MSEERSKIMDNLIAQDADLIDKLRDEDSYYRLQEKHWCIDAEELERQRLAAADRIERLRDALIRISNLSPAVTHGWAEEARQIARAALGEDDD